MDDEMKREFSGIKQAIAGLTQRIDGRFDSVDGRLDRLEKGSDRLEKDLADTKEDSANTKSVVRRVAAAVSKLVQETADIRRVMATTQDLGRHDKRLAAFMTEIGNLRNERMLNDKSFIRHEDRLDEHDRRISRLEARSA
jgi:chromosome segregation ATPase